MENVGSDVAECRCGPVHMVHAPGCGCKISVPTSYDMGIAPQRLGEMSVLMLYDIGWSPQLIQMSVPMSYDIGARRSHTS
eukprot:10378689-Karenia_brevis.AAC.1